MGDTAVGIAAAVRAGHMTARAAVAADLGRIAERDPRIGAFQVVRTAAALNEALAIDQRPDRGSLPLAGVPIAIKDNVPVRGEPMRAGSMGSDPGPQRSDHEIVRRLRNAGAVVAGLSRLPELWVFGTTDSKFGITRNPWALDRTPGGSSGGSAAAVAAGMVAVAHGNDGMGSIRVPAACCGVVGMKPGRGVVPADIGDSSWFNMGENGVLATTVADCALVLSVLAGRPELAAVSSPSRLRIAVSTVNPLAGFRVDASWAAAAHNAGAALRQAGHSVRPANPPYTLRAAPYAIVRWVAGTEQDRRQLAYPEKIEKRTRGHAAAGRLALRAGFPKPKGRELWQRKAGAFFAGVDVLITPMLALSPVRALAWSERGWLANVLSNARYAPFAAAWNLAGWPAIAVPAGVGDDGMPRSVQLVAGPGGEGLLLSLAAQLEALRPWPLTAPQFPR